MSRENKKANTVWEKVNYLRNTNRFGGEDVLHGITDDFYELHGDRYYGDDNAIVGGLASIGGRHVTIIAQSKGKNSRERVSCNYGMPLPEGYRKALRLMKQANKFGRPIVNIIDTPGAYPGIEAEARGQAEAIAQNLYCMSSLKVPIIAIIIGEGGSGGALAMSVANKIIMLQNAIFSVVSPEGCASILWKDRKLAPKAAENLKITAHDLFALGIVDEIVEEKGTLEYICMSLKK